MLSSIEFDAEFFNEIYFEIEDAWNDFALRFIFIYGGSSSSKTWSIVQRIIIYMLEGKGNNTYVFKKISARIDETIFATFVSVINAWGLSHLFIIQKHYIKCRVTGAYTSFSGLDDADKVKGLEGYRKIYIDELDQIAYADYKQLRKRLRGQVGQQIIASFNPVDELCFIKVDIFDKENWQELPTKAGDLKQLNAKKNMLTIRTNYLYNKWIVGDGKGGGFIDTHTIADFEHDRLTDINLYNIYALGHWGRLQTGVKFFKQFDASRHVGTHPYKPTEPLHIVFDENVLPYLTCNVFQFHNGKVVQIDEIMLEDPRNTLEETCKEYLVRYGSNMQGLFVYGDATSRKQDTKLQKGLNFYKLVQKYLISKQPIFRVPSSNPSVVLSRLFVDNLLKDNRVAFDARCRKSINDYHYCSENEEGGVNKRVIRDKNTGASYQEFGHASDCLRYLLTIMYNSDYRLSLKR